MTIALVVQGAEFMHHVGAAAATAKMSKNLAAHIRRCDNAAVERVLGTYKESEDADAKLHEDFRSIVDTINNFTKYVPKEVVTALIEQGTMQSGMEAKTVTLVFTDIANFTSMCETMSPNELLELTGLYFEKTTKTLLEHGCTIDKFIGDAVMGFWGAPLPHQDQGFAACCGTLHLQGVVDEIAPEFEQAGYHLRTRIGLHKGSAVVGNMGCKWRLSYTALGDSVNLASRLEGLNKAYSTRILLSEAVLDDIMSTHGRCDFAVRRLGPVRVKGKLDATVVYSLLGVSSAAKVNAASLSVRLPGMFLTSLERRNSFADMASLSRSGSRRGSMIGSPIGNTQSPDGSRRGSVFALSTRSADGSSRQTFVCHEDIVRPHTAAEAFEHAQRLWPIDDVSMATLKGLSTAQRQYEEGSFAGAASVLRDSVSAYNPGFSSTPGTRVASALSSPRRSSTHGTIGPTSPRRRASMSLDQSMGPPHSPRGSDPVSWPATFTDNGLTLDSLEALLATWDGLAAAGCIPDDWDPVVDAS